MLDRKLGYPRAFQDLVDKVARSSVQVGEIWSIGHQTSRIDVLAIGVSRRQARAQR